MVERNNVFAASDWFDVNFFGKFLHSNLNIIEQFNVQKHTIGEEHDLTNYKEYIRIIRGVKANGV